VLRQLRAGARRHRAQPEGHGQRPGDVLEVRPTDLWYAPGLPQLPLLGQEVPRRVPQKAPQEAPQRVPQKAPQDVRQEVPQGVPQEVALLMYSREGGVEQGAWRFTHLFLFPFYFFSFFFCCCCCSQKSARRRYKIFKQHYDTLLRLKAFFPFHLIDGMGTLAECREQVRVGAPLGVPGAGNGRWAWAR